MNRLRNGVALLDTARMENEKKLAVSVREAAAMIGISPRGLQNYISSKKIPVRKLGKRTVILVRTLEAFLRADQPSVSPPRRGRITEGEQP